MMVRYVEAGAYHCNGSGNSEAKPSNSGGRKSDSESGKHVGGHVPSRMLSSHMGL